jgi:ATP-binding protein involved in chromosome partitioning
MTIEDKQIYNALQDIVPKARIQGLQIGKDGAVLFAIIVDPALGTAMEDLRLQAEKTVSAVAGVTKVTAILTAEKPAQQNTAPDPHGNAKNPKLDLPIKKIIAVASGKGGVGKSTVAVNLAAALAQTGQSVGLLDADIYGPSVPTLCGLPNEKPSMNDLKQLIPFEAHGLKVMSMGFMVDQNTPMIWRGPMVQSAIYQMLRDVAWVDSSVDETEGKPLDILVIDMPPGTGDAQLTIAQKIDVDGAVIVSTPQDLALLDAIKAIEMFNKTNVPILGLIENMSTHICSACGHEDDIFGNGTIEIEAQKRSVPYLGAIPLDKHIRENADAGRLSNGDIYEDKYKTIAEQIFSSL